MTLDVVLPTRNRARLLADALQSLLAADVPADFGVNIIVVDNGSTDATPGLLEWMSAKHRGRIYTVRERRCGKSRALNAGISAGTADLIGMIDDDEVVGPRWFTEIHRAFTSDPELDFIGGPYVAAWQTPPPRWIPLDYLAVLGDVDGGPSEMPYGRDFPGILKGGNAVIRRRVLEQVGPYAEYLGPAGAARLLSCEDEEMYLRLLGAGARGRYLPSLVIQHRVSADRLTPAYFRRWCFWRGVSRGLMDRAHPMPVRYFAGVPRFLYGSALRGLARWVKPSERTLSDELKIWDLSGYLWGRHIYTLARFSPVRSRRAALDSSLQVVEPSEVNSSDAQWNPSCYFDGQDGGECASDRYQAGGERLAEPRRTSAPTL